SREGRTVADIFSTHGEPYFRRIERAVLLGLLPERHMIVATGGGTFANPANRADIARDGTSVWLDVPLARLVDRVPSDGRRPLAANRDAFTQLFHERRLVYQQADIHLDADDHPVDALVERLLDRLGW